jgi:hypothetical protein
MEYFMTTSISIALISASNYDVKTARAVQCKHLHPEFERFNQEIKPVSRAEISISKYITVAINGQKNVLSRQNCKSI